MNLPFQWLEAAGRRNWKAACKPCWSKAIGKNPCCCFFRDLLKTPNQELIALQAGPNWPTRLAAAHTILRELQSINHYVFAPQRFHALHNPVLLLLGGDSHARRYMTAERLQQSLPNSRIGILPGQQHSAMRTAPELFAHTVIEFLAGKN